jgi:hypothetical protein
MHYTTGIWEDSMTTRKNGGSVEFCFSSQVNSHQDAARVILICMECKLSDQIIPQMKSTTIMELKKLEDLSIGVIGSLHLGMLEQLIYKSNKQGMPPNYTKTSWPTPSQHLMQLLSLLLTSHQMMINYVLCWR